MNCEFGGCSWLMSAKFWRHIQPLLPKYAPPTSRGGHPRTNLRCVWTAFSTCCETVACGRPCRVSSVPAARYIVTFKSGPSGLVSWLLEVALEAIRLAAAYRMELAKRRRLYDQGPAGREKNGRNPTDRGKLGVKRSILTDRRSLLSGVTVSGANTHHV